METPTASLRPASVPGTGTGMTTDRLSRRAGLLLALERLWPVDAGAVGLAGLESAYELGRAQRDYGPFVDELGGLAGLRVLDFGCGWGGQAVYLASRGAAAVDGCDIEPDSVAAARAFAREQGVADGVSFHVNSGTTLPFEDARFDVALSVNVFEHVMDLPAMLGEIARVLRPGGRLLTRFGPMFYSPRGYHMAWATQVPWAHLLFGLGPMLEVRGVKRGPLRATGWRELGLNMATFEDFRDAALRAGLVAERLRRVPVSRSGPLASLPGLSRLLTFGVDARLRKPASRA